MSVTDSTRSGNEHTTARVGAPLDPSPGPELEPGTRVGRYLVLRRLGEGGMGVVYLADDPELDRRVAVKILQPKRRRGGGAEAAQLRLQREAQAIAKLSHPNVVAVHDVGRFGEGVFVAMEYVDGPSLRTWATSSARTLDELLRVFIDAGRGLAAAHAAGIVHRDVKPDNILLADGSQPRLVDFGLARTAEPSSQGRPPSDPVDSGAKLTSSELLSRPVTMLGEVMGTPAYMSPEHDAGRPTPSSDQFSFCVTLYEAVLQRRPFEGRSRRDLAAARRRGVTFPARPPVPRGLRRILARGLSVYPGDRYPSMGDLLGALGRFRARRRRRWTAAGGIVLLAGAATFGWSQATRPPADACASDETDRMWDDGGRGALARAFEATGSTLADDTWPRVRGRLDAWASAFVDARRDACEATLVRNEQSGAVMDLRNACLDMQRQAFEAVVVTLRDADEAVVAKADETVDALPDVAECADVAALQRRPPVPDDPDQRQQVQRLRGVLAEAAARRNAGRFEAARESLTAVAASLDELDYAAVRAEYELQRGMLQRSVGELPEAEKALRRAVRAAEVAGYASLRVEALLELAMVLGVHLKSFAAAEEVLALAEAAIAGLGEPAGLRVQLRFSQAELLVARDLGARAREIYEELLEGDLRAIGRDVVLARLAKSGGRGRGLGTQTYREALLIAEERFGPNHPRVAQILVDMAHPLMVGKDFEEAQAVLERAQAIREEVFGPDSRPVAEVRGRFGVLAIRRDDLETAKRELTSVLATYDADPDTVEFDRAQIMTNLAIIYSREGDQGRARRMHLRALEAMERTDPDHPRRVVPAMNIAMTYQREQDVEGSVEWLDKASQMASQQPNGCDLAGRLQRDAAEQLQATGDAAAFRLHLRRALDYDDRCAAGEPSERAASTRWELARSLATAGRDDEAQALLEQALADVRQLDSKEAPVLAVQVRIALAKSLSRTGDETGRARQLAVQARDAMPLARDQVLTRRKRESDAEYEARNAERRAQLRQIEDEVAAWLNEHPAAPSVEP